MTDTETTEYVEFGFQTALAQEADTATWPDSDGDLYLHGEYHLASTKWDSAAGLADRIAEELWRVIPTGARLVKRHVTTTTFAEVFPLPTATGSVIRANVQGSKADCLRLLFARVDTPTHHWVALSGGVWGVYYSDDQLTDWEILFVPTEAAE